MKQKKSNIDLGKIAKQLLAHKRLVIRNLLIAAVVSAALIVCVPRYYTCDVMLAPEFGNTNATSSLASIASSFGVSLGNDVQSDAISPSLYPDLLTSKEFLVGLFPVKVTSQDGLINTDYYTYIKEHQKMPWWKNVTRWIKRTIKNAISKPKAKAKPDYKNANPFNLGEEVYNVAESISKKITCTVDRRSYVITIRITDQDPLICATMADSVRIHLQNFIIKYRSSKARVDVEYYEKLLAKAKQDYDKAMHAYSVYADSHRDMILQTYISQRDNLENDMQMAFNIYTSVNQQLEQAKAKLQESIPAFTTLKCASVPVKPTGPKRVMFVLGMMILTFLATAYYIIKIKRRKATKNQPKENIAPATDTETESTDAK